MRDMDSGLTTCSQRTLNTADFLAQGPLLSSTGFRLTVPFGSNYQHQASITEDIPAQLTAALYHALRSRGYGQYLIHLSVEFAEAGASSLDLHVFADFSGDAAPRHDMLRRTIQCICVDTCNAQAWGIPFAQPTLHMVSPMPHTSPSLPDVIRPHRRPGKPVPRTAGTERLLAS
jgi:hypothetical protein